ncbi:MAG: SDR family NAD(P)-dependent oxidoreductase [Nevskia sp.]|nr:SDR family NAD(P)-dependent oxidoreductase [Nevskia sp.]
MTGKHVIVTGAAPGSLGFETARILTDWGATVVITTRSDPRAAAEALRLAGQNGRTPGHHALDLSLADSVTRFTEWYAADYGQLDVLVNNAGVHLDLLAQWKQPRLTPDGVEIHWRTNYLGAAQLTHQLLPLLQRTAQKSGAARVVNVSSMLHSRGSNAGLFSPPPRYNSWTAYGLSKLALIHFSFELQRRHGERDGVHAYCLHPGAVYTHIADKGLAGHPVIQSIRRALAPVESFFLLTPEEGAQTQIHCATQAAASGGLYYVKCQPAQASADAQDARISAALWENTLAWIDGLG